MQGLLQLSAAVGAGSRPTQFDGHVDLDPLVSIDSQQVEVVHVSAERVPLDLAKHHFLVLAVDRHVEHADAPVDQRTQRSGLDLDRDRVILVPV